MQQGEQSLGSYQWTEFSFASLFRSVSDVPHDRRGTPCWLA